ncbi:DUF2182 domain-containing protein [Roseibium sp. MMSF_3412]|uniref:DUF2182 domain-containing protein n=1 Tax=Roseibium sp. MMSF_3412 TaxID=3046712 RepID=UPI00273FBDB6|nr:DUF2182 domain-containing protein [Roseibium sp. MMSF_3412]
MKALTRLLPGHGTLWLMFFGSVLAAWALLLATHMPVAAPHPAGDFGLAYLISLCTQSVADAGFGSAVAMWSLMSLAMMAPTAFPAFKTYSDMTCTEAASGTSLAVLVAGYLLVWIGFAVPAAFVQVQLAELHLLDAVGRSTSGTFSALLLLLAGAYQFSRLKNACLSACQNPMTFFFSHWQPGNLGALRLGLRLGAVCLGCCWALMLLAFVAGTMNLAFMALAMLLMTLEKLPQIGDRISAPLGVFLIISGTVVGVLSLIELSNGGI